MKKFRKFIIWFLRPKIAELWHPESPGDKVIVTRTWIGRLFKPSCFATLNETLKSKISWKENKNYCPICGYNFNKFEL